MEGAVRLAVVGSTQFADDPIATDQARGVIAAAIEFYRPTVVISGGARGIDSLAREVAVEHGISVVEHLPAHPRWADGYKPRNLLVAEDCTHLLCIRHPNSKTYGSGWTADRAEEMGRVVHRREVGRDRPITGELTAL